MRSELFWYIEQLEMGWAYDAFDAVSLCQGRTCQNGMSYRELYARSSVPISTISAYARGQAESPDADNLSRIAQAFGDSPDTVAQLRARAEAQAEEDARIVWTLRQTFDGLLDDANAQYTQRLAAVQEQYRDYLMDAEQLYAERMEAEQRHHAQIVEQMRKNAQTMDQRSEEGRRYLKRLVRALAAFVVVLMVLLGVFAAYGVYAFNAFDRNDPARGIYREEVQREENK